MIFDENKILRGLECCRNIDASSKCAECPYKEQCDGEYDKLNIPRGNALIRDTFDYMQRIEAKVDKILTMAQSIIGRLVRSDDDLK